MNAPSPEYLELAEQAGGFIHELKNHINGLSLNLQLLAEELDQPETPRERKALARVDRLTTECQRLVTLSQDFLKFTRVDAPCLICDDMSVSVSRLVDFLTPTAKAQNIDIVWHEAANLPRVQYDPELFERALLNIMLNAEDAMADGGTLTLQARVEVDAVALDVIDTGCGMDEALLAQLFQPFLTTKPHGNGLGLAIARKGLHVMNGTLRVKSQPGRGTLFTMTLPLAEAP
jgi:two-component system, NtrC family, sensor histidine kinase HydH